MVAEHWVPPDEVVWVAVAAVDGTPLMQSVGLAPA